MFTQEIQVTYRDGRQETVITDQSDVAAWEMWARQRRLQASAPDRPLMSDMPVLFMRVASWNATNRQQTIRQDFDIWDQTVVEVEMVEAQEATPFPEATQGEPSPTYQLPQE